MIVLATKFKGLSKFMTLHYIGNNPYEMILQMMRLSLNQLESAEKNFLSTAFKETVLFISNKILINFYF
jgi:hypothetical protein